MVRSKSSSIAHAGNSYVVSEVVLFVVVPPLWATQASVGFEPVVVALNTLPIVELVGNTKLTVTTPLVVEAV